MTLEKIIILIGIDGSGKTRHGRKLASGFVKSGRKSRYVWMRSAYFFSLPFMALCRVLGFAVIHKLPNGRTCTEHLYHKRPISLIWPWIQFLDLLLFVAVKIYIPLIRGYLMVVDRFVHDILVDLMVDVNNPELHKSLVGQLILRLIPTGAITFLFDVDKQTALQRKTDIPNLRYLMVRIRYYRFVACYLKIPRINTFCSFDPVHEQLLRELKKRRALLALDCIKRQLRNRLQARARWKKWKKGPVAMLRRSLKKVLYRLMGAQLGDVKVKSNLSMGKDEFGRSVSHGLRSYIELLRGRGLKVHTVLLLGSRAKGHWKSRSDLDIIIVASELPKGLRRRLIKYTVLSDIPLFLGIEPYGCTRDEFLGKLEDLDLMALDAMYWGKIVFDDGFWVEATRKFEEVERDYALEKIQLRQMLFLI